MSRRTNAPLVSRACHAAAQVFAFDRTLAQAFVQLDADVEIERAAVGRHADARAWLALVRLLVVAVPTTMGQRVVELEWREWRVLLDALGRLGAMPLGIWATIAVLESFWPRSPASSPFPALPAFMLFMTWIVVGDRLVPKVTATRITGVLTATIAGGVAGWLVFGLWAEPALAGSGPLTAPGVSVRALLLPALAGQTAWLSAQFALRNRGLFDVVPPMALVGALLVGCVAAVGGILWTPHLLDAQLTCLYVGLMALSLAGTALLTARIANHPVVAEDMADVS